MYQDEDVTQNTALIYHIQTQKKKRCIQSWLFGVRLWIGVVCPGKDYFSYLQNSFISLLP